MNRPDKFLAIIISFCGGVFLASFGVNFWTMLILGIISGGIIFYSQGRLALLLIIIFLAGFLYFSLNNYLSQKNPSIYLTNQEVITTKAIIIAEPEIKEFSIWLRAKLSNDQLTKILIKTQLQNSYLEYGDEIILKGELNEPENSPEFNLQNYLSKENIYLTANYPEINILKKGQSNYLKDKLIKIKKIFISLINKFLPEPEASFLGGLLLGGKNNLPKIFKENLNRAGASHLVALSGFNITIIASAVIAGLLLLGVSRPASFWLAVSLIIVFVLIVGASPSIMRAAVMGVLALMGSKIGRLYRPRNALFLAGLIMILINPKILVFDAGFQLSFVATLGILYLFPFFKNILRIKSSDFFGFREMFALTLSAQTAVLPLLILYFGYFSIVAPLSNFFLLLAIPPTMFFGFIGVSVGFIFPLFGKVLSLPAFLLLKYEVEIINFFGNLSFAGISFNPTIQYLLVAISTIGVTYLFWWANRTQPNL